MHIINISFIYLYSWTQQHLTSGDVGWEGWIGLLRMTAAGNRTPYHIIIITVSDTFTNYAARPRLPCPVNMLSNWCVTLTWWLSRQLDNMTAIVTERVFTPAVSGSLSHAKTSPRVQIVTVIIVAQEQFKWRVHRSLQFDTYYQLLV